MARRQWQQIQAEFHALTDALRMSAHRCGGIGIEHLVRGFAPQRQPAIEMFHPDGMRAVFRQRIAVIRAHRQDHRTPERGEQALVHRPIGDDRIEYRAQQWISTDFVVEAVDQALDLHSVELL